MHLKVYLFFISVLYIVQALSSTGLYHTDTISHQIYTTHVQTHTHSTFLFLTYKSPEFEFVAVSQIIVKLISIRIQLHKVFFYFFFLNKSNLNQPTNLI